MKARHTLLLLTLLSAAAAAAPPAPTQLLASRGGALRQPVEADSYVYLPTGSTLTAWQRLPDGSLQASGDTRATPAHGWLTGLARRGDYLYASYRGYSMDVNGVAVYAISDRAHPQLLGQYEYSQAEFRMAGSIAVSGDYLYVLDNEQGVFAAPLASSPAVPVFTQVHAGWGSFAYASVHAGRLYTSGRTFLSGTALDIFDLSNPTAPQPVGSATLDGFDNFRLRVSPPYAYGFGLAVNVVDISDPAAITPRGRVDAPAAYEGLVLGSHAWSLGLDGLDIWNIADPDAPAAAGHAQIDTFATDAAAVLGSDALLATRADRLVRLDATQPATPAVRGSAQLPAGTAAYDIAVRNGTALLLGNAYGLNVSTPVSLESLGRFDTSLPASLQGRAFEQLAVDGSRAYLASWGSGLVIADISNPRQPQELGYWEYPFATAIVARGNRAYVGRSTNGGELVVLDVSNPASPQPLGGLVTSKILRLALHDHYVYVADEARVGNQGAGLIIVDVSNPAAPAEVARYAGCGSVSDLDLSRDGRRALIACGDSAHLVDISNPLQPTQLAVYTATARSVALRGQRAWVGDDTGIAELDISNAAQPALLQRWDLPLPPRRIQAAGDGHVYALTDMAGVYVFRPDTIFGSGLQ